MFLQLASLSFGSIDIDGPSTLISIGPNFVTSLTFVHVLSAYRAVLYYTNDCTRAGVTMSKLNPPAKTVCFSSLSSHYGNHDNKSTVSMKHLIRLYSLLECLASVHRLITHQVRLRQYLQHPSLPFPSKWSSLEMKQNEPNLSSGTQSPTR